jgi:mercuric ion transport protein
MKARRLPGFSIAGTAVTAVCCFTPAMAVLLGGLGLSAWLAWLDYLLLPMLAAFIALTLFALMRLLRRAQTGYRDG